MADDDSRGEGGVGTAAAKLVGREPSAGQRCDYCGHDAEAHLDDDLTAIAAVGAPPVTFVLDARGVIRWRSNTVLPDRLDDEMDRLLEHTRAILAEE